MYKVIGSDGKEHGPADLPTLEAWARAGSIVPNTELVDVNTGQVFRAAQVPSLQPILGHPSSVIAPTPVSQQQPAVVIQQTQRGPGCLVSTLWFLFVGWWLGGLAISVAWFLNVTVIGLPLGMAILNSVPKIIALQEPARQMQTVAGKGATFVTETTMPQHNFLLRALFFVLVGWWWSGVWLGIAYTLCATVILAPVALPMFRMTPFMTTLARY